jgi:hypothetical protein
VEYLGTTYNLNLEINPGVVTYFRFKGRNGFFTDLPPAPGSDFDPETDIQPVP